MSGLDLLAGVDVSTKRLAIVRLELPDGWLYDYNVLDIARDLNRAELARTPALAVFARIVGECRVAYYEDPAGFNVGAVARLNRILGACQHATPRAVPVNEYTPPKWKALAGLKGNAGKDAIARRAVELYPDLAELLPNALEDAARKTPRGVWEQDVLDAACIAVAGLNETAAHLERTESS